MDLHLDGSIVAYYHSGAQISRVLTETWVEQNMFCPRCGNAHIAGFENNRPVADFYCPNCGSQYELKSKQGHFGVKVPDGAYETMIQRITGNDNPDFLFLGYSLSKMAVNELIMIPKYFFIPSIIERRPPLRQDARRAGWVGCNIILGNIPHQGRIDIISNGREVSRESVMERARVSQRLKTDNINARGWLLDMLSCVNSIPSDEFTLDDAYSFENELSELHPDNHNIRPKIRQQLQLLRNKGFIRFLGNGRYRKESI